MPEAKLSRRKLLKRGLALGTLALAGDAFGVEPNWIEVEPLDFPVKGLGKGFDGYRIALFSDLHWPRHVERGHLEKAIKLANAFDPDLVAIPGDLIDRVDRSVPLEPVPDLRGLFDGLRARDGVVASLGNHDHLFSVTDLVSALASDTPLDLLTNAHRLLRRGDDALAIGGVDDLWLGHVDPVAAFAGVSDETPRILLSHNPDVAEDVVWPTRVDLQLSGHTHGGEVCIPFGPAALIPSKYGQKFRAGLVQGRSHPVYVGRGLCSIRRMRFCCRPEVTHITLRTA